MLQFSVLTDFITTSKNILISYRYNI